MERQRFLTLLEGLEPLEQQRLLTLLEGLEPLEQQRLLTLLEGLAPLAGQRLLTLLGVLEPCMWYPQLWTSVLLPTDLVQGKRWGKQEVGKLLTLLERLKPLEQQRLLTLLEGLEPLERQRLLTLLDGLDPLEQQRLLTLWKLQGLLKLLEPQQQTNLQRFNDIYVEKVKYVVDRVKYLQTLEERVIIWESLLEFVLKYLRRLELELLLEWLRIYLSLAGYRRGGFRNLLLDGWWLEFWEIILLAAGDVDYDMMFGDL